MGDFLKFLHQCKLISALLAGVVATGIIFSSIAQAQQDWPRQQLQDTNRQLEQRLDKQQHNQQLQFQMNQFRSQQMRQQQFPPLPPPVIAPPLLHQTKKWTPLFG